MIKVTVLDQGIGGASRHAQVRKVPGWNAIYNCQDLDYCRYQVSYVQRGIRDRIWRHPKSLAIFSWKWKRYEALAGSGPKGQILEC